MILSTRYEIYVGDELLKKKFEKLKNSRKLSKFICDASIEKLEKDPDFLQEREIFLSELLEEVRIKREKALKARKQKVLQVQEEKVARTEAEAEAELRDIETKIKAQLDYIENNKDAPNLDQRFVGLNKFISRYDKVGGDLKHIYKKFKNHKTMKLYLKIQKGK